MKKTSSTVEINGKVYNLISPESIKRTPKKITISDTATQPSASLSKSTVSDVVGPKLKPAITRNAKEINHNRRSVKKSQTLVRTASRSRAKHSLLSRQNKAGFVVKPPASAPQKNSLITKFHSPKDIHQLPAANIQTTKKHVPVTHQRNQQAAQHLAHLTLEHIESKVQNKLVDPFEQAVKDATSHIHNHYKLESPVQRIKKLTNPFGSKTRTALTSSVLLAAFMVGAYQTIPEVRVKMASIKANVPASLPTYRPVGFGIAGPVKSEPGKVELTYKSNTNDSQFKITQEASNWTSESLLNNQVLASSKPFQTFQQNGKTVYVSDGKNASWVNGGVLYNVEGSQNLNQDQLLKIAESL